MNLDEPSVAPSSLSSGGPNAPRRRRWVVILICMLVASLAIAVFAWRQQNSSVDRDRSIRELRGTVTLHARNAILEIEDRTTGFRGDVYFKNQLVPASYEAMQALANRSGPGPRTPEANWQRPAPPDATACEDLGQNFLLCPKDWMVYIHIH